MAHQSARSSNQQSSRVRWPSSCPFWTKLIGWRADWILTIDADVHPSPALARSLLATAKERNLRMLSVATTQRLSGVAEGLLHPALLATLVYRFGRPGGSTRSPSGAIANGQCCLI